MNDDHVWEVVETLEEILQQYNSITPATLQQYERYRCSLCKLEKYYYPQQNIIYYGSWDTYFVFEFTSCAQMIMNEILQ